MVHLQMNNQWMKFKIDSGADVTVIAEADYLEASHYSHLQQS